MRILHFLCRSLVFLIYLCRDFWLCSKFILQSCLSLQNTNTFSGFSLTLSLILVDAQTLVKECQGDPVTHAEEIESQSFSSVSSAKHDNTSVLHADEIEGNFAYIYYLWFSTTLTYIYIPTPQAFAMQIDFYYLKFEVHLIFDCLNFYTATIFEQFSQQSFSGIKLHLFWPIFWPSVLLLQQYEKKYRVNYLCW